MDYYTRKHQLTANLLSILEADGYPLGTDIALQVQTLLRQLPEGVSDEVLSDSLVPLLARNPAEQEQVRTIFERCVREANALKVKKQVDPKVEAEGKKWWRRIIIPLVLLLGLAGYGLWNVLNPPLVDPGDVPGQVVDDPDNIIKIDSLNPNEFKDSVIVENPILADGQFAKLFPNKTEPYPHGDLLDKYLLNEPDPASVWLKQNWWWLRLASAFLLTLMLLAIWRYRAWKNRQLIAQQKQNEKPPYIWNIHLDTNRDFLQNEGVEAIVQSMRHRASTDTLRLDVPKTIKATVEKGGMPDFRFRQQSAPVDYLLLIDRQTLQNHRARFYDKLYHHLREQEVEVARYFYDSDLRVCYNEQNPQGIPLSKVKQQPFGTRLMVVGTGGQLLSPVTGKAAVWTSFFNQWKNRVLFSPKPTRKWGWDERQLEKVMPVLPASMQSMSFWLEEQANDTDARIDNWSEKVKDSIAAPIQPDENDPIPFLELYYEYPLMRWLAACAIYPDLHWDLTLWLGQRLSNVNVELLTIENLTQLFRLSWFVEGKMPDEVRKALLKWLEEDDPELLFALRGGLAAELEKNPPPKDSVAWDAYRMNVATNAWMAEKDAKRKKELEKEIAGLLESGIEPDFTVVKYLDAPQTPLDFVVPKTWKKYVHPSGYSAFGWIKEYADLKWLIPIWLIGLIALFWNYDLTIYDCSEDNIVQINDSNFCLDTPEKKLLFHEIKLREAVQNDNRLLIDSLTAPSVTWENENLPQYDYAYNLLTLLDGNSSDSVRLLKNEIEKNIATHFYKRIKNHFVDIGEVALQEPDSFGCSIIDQLLRLDSVDLDYLKLKAELCQKEEVQDTLINIVAKIIGLVQSGNSEPLEGVNISGLGVNLSTDRYGTYTMEIPKTFSGEKVSLNFQKKGYNTIIKRFILKDITHLNTIVLQENTVDVLNSDNSVLKSDSLLKLNPTNQDSLKMEKSTSIDRKLHEVFDYKILRFENDVIIEWRAWYSSDTIEYRIMRSINKEPFKEIGRTNGSGGTAESIYSFNDINVGKNEKIITLSYELKIIPWEKEVEFKDSILMNVEKIQTTPPTNLDKDGDSIPDSKDACPNFPGMAKNLGCPDTDKDGTPDMEDVCPMQPGRKSFQGCPDSDGDGIPDRKDECPYAAGTSKNKGCPKND